MKLHIIGAETFQYPSLKLKIIFQNSDKLVMKYFIPLLLFVLIGCGQDLTRNPGARSDRTDYSALTCSCGDYSSPVCGFNGTQYITFLNGCIAQCNGFSYTSGACAPQSGSAQQQCDSNSGQVCGIPPCTTQGSCPGASVYSDQCELQSNNATQVDLSQCSL